MDSVVIYPVISSQKLYPAELDVAFVQSFYFVQNCQSIDTRHAINWGWAHTSATSYSSNWVMFNEANEVELGLS